MAVPVPDVCAIREDCAKESESAGERLLSRRVWMVQRVMGVQVRDGCVCE
jgi:hypothetical protein